MDKNDSHAIEAIDFKSLRKKTDVGAAQKQPLVSKKLALLLAFLPLVACGFGVFLLLPNYVAEKQVPRPISINTQIEVIEAEATATAKLLAPKTPNLSVEEVGALKLQAENLLLQVIKKQEVLLARGITRWAHNEFLQSSFLGATGDGYFRKQDFTLAISSYEQAISALQRLEKQVTPTLTKHLKLGERALAQGEASAAAHHFEIAKAIGPNNRQALNGLTRASTIKELFMLLEIGGNLEAANRLEEAKKTYQQAVDLDPLSPDAKIAISRVAKRLTKIKFSRLISLGYSSLGLRQFNDARSAFRSAQRLLPNSDKPNKGLEKVEQTIRNEKISSLTIEAKYFEDNEDWGYAAQSYQQILALSPNVAFAVDGAKKASQRASLLSALDDHIGSKDRLTSPLVVKEVHNLLQEIASLDSPGNKILQRAAFVKRLLELANRPVWITLQSDGQTEVVIFRVGRYGRFENKKVELKPGKYTIVGSRPGYRDVRKVLMVSVDMASKDIMVRCEEPI